MRGHIAGVYGAYYQVRIAPVETSPGTNPEITSEQQTGRLVLSKLRGKFRLQEKDSIQGREADNPLAIGDEVEVQLLKGSGAVKENGPKEAEASIEKIYPRRNCFIRSSHNRLQMLASNLDCVIIINSLDNPLFNEGLLYRILVETELNRIPAIIVLNKTDFLKGANQQEKEIYQVTYEKVDYLSKLDYIVKKETFVKRVSADLRKKLSGKRLIAFGQSGVGKSTFVNTLVGHELQSTKEIGAHKKGQHTTTNPIMYTTSDGMEIIDVPGIREFGLLHRSKAEISQGFREMNNLQCRFDNCSHIKEPGCMVNDALENGTISSSRYKSYVHILNSLLHPDKIRRGDYR